MHNSVFDYCTLSGKADVLAICDKKYQSGGEYGSVTAYDRGL